MPQTIRAKFKCVNVSKSENWNKKPGKEFLYTAVLNAVAGGSPENEKFWEATPSGGINLASILPDAFEVGKEYFVDFSSVEDQATTGVTESQQAAPAANA